MIAYNRQSLDHRTIQEEAGNALAKKIITAEEHASIREAYPFKLYNPNFWVRIGLFLLTVLGTSCCLGLLLLAGLGNNIGSTLIVYGIIVYGACEYFIRSKSLFRSGADEALLWIASGLLLTGINFLVEEHRSFIELTPTMQSLIVFLLALLGALRYINRLMALVAYGALISLFFNMAIRQGAMGRALLPFLIMVVAIASYQLFIRLSAVQRLRYYADSLEILRMITLILFYLAGNYYVIRELNAQLSGEPGSGSGSSSVNLGWLWWGLTGITPIFYIFKGIQKKDPIWLWAGLALVAAAIFTFRYYYHVLPAEWAMIIGGGLLIAAAYRLIRWLRSERHGFTSAMPQETHVLENLPVEGLILAETFQSVAAQPEGPDFRFGGGSGGGGGAGGDF
ncbi:hypothetical protein ACX0G9_12770 [Flavitalea flava]